MGPHYLNRNPTTSNNQGICSGVYFYLLLGRLKRVESAQFGSRTVVRFPVCTEQKAFGVDRNANYVCPFVKRHAVISSIVLVFVIL